MNRSLRVLLLPLCLLPTACVKAPPVLNPTSVAAPAIPLAPPLTDSSQFGYVRAHQIVRFADRVGAGSLVNMGASRGVDLRALDPEKPLVVVVGDPGPGGGFDKLPITGQLPIAPGGAMAQRLSALLGGERVTEHGGGVAIAVNAPPGGAALVDSLAAAPLTSDLELYLRISSLMVRYGDQVHRGLAQVEQQMQKEASGGLDAGVASAYVGWLKGLIDNMDSITLGVGAGESAISMSTINQDKSTGPLSLPTTAKSMADLAQFVPPGDLRFEVGGRNFEKWIDLALSFYQPMFKDDAAGFADLRAVMTTMAKGRTQAAFSISVIPERLVGATFVLLADDAGDKFEAVRKMAAVMGRPAFQQGYAKTGFDVTVTAQQNVRQIESWPVDHYIYDFKLNANAKVRELERLITKPMEVDVIRTGSYLVYQMNGTPESFEKTVRDLLAGKGPHPTLAARADHPVGGYLYGDLDVARLLESVRSIVREDKRNDVPRLDPAMPRITTFGYDAGTVGWHRVNVPTRLVDAIRELAAGSGKKQNGPYLPPPN